MKTYLLLVSFAVAFLMECQRNSAFAQSDFNNQLFGKTVAFHDDTAKLKFVSNTQLFHEGWDALPQANFWQEVISLSPDSVIINVALNRQKLHVISAAEWFCQQDSEKEEYRNYLRRTYGLDESESIFVTTGKREFYEYKKVVPMIPKAVDVFVKLGVDPWYAQTILLIESPGKSNQKSSAGAYGPFQLMRSVGKKFGLVINKYADERADLVKSAGAAAKLLGTICIPNVKAILDAKNIAYSETDLWFRLLVMHAYHAGSGNVSCMMEKLNPQEGGIKLFNEIWKNECRGFKNESQNYSQIALANLILFDKLIDQSSDTAFIVMGDRLLSRYKRAGLTYSQASDYLKSCITAYENDLVEGVIPFEYFYRKVNTVQKEIAYLELKNPSDTEAKIAGAFPVRTEQFIKIGDQLMRKRKIEDAIKVYKLNVEKYPDSAKAYDSLGRAYKVLGKNELALKYYNKSLALKGN